MKPNQLLLHCYGEYKNGVWQAFCLDFTIAVQGESPEEVVEKLKEQVCEYINDALVGVDQEHSRDLISRKAPLKYWAKYYFIRAMFSVHRLRDDIFCLFDLPLPVTAKGC